jgi:hypothetical protein
MISGFIAVCLGVRRFTDVGVVHVAFSESMLDSSQGTMFALELTFSLRSAGTPSREPLIGTSYAYRRGETGYVDSSGIDSCPAGHHLGGTTC